MKAALVLLAHSLKRVRTLVCVMGAILALFQVLLTLAARSIEEANAFGRISSLIPDFVRQLLGPSFVAFMSFGGIVCVGYFHLAVVGTLVGLTIALATESTSEIETGFMDLILARPLARHWVISRSVALLAVCTTFVLLMMILGTFTGLYWLAPEGTAWPESNLIRSLVVNLGALLMCWGGVALAISAVSRRRSVAGSLVGILAFATYLLDYLARLWRPAEKVGWLSPFRYYSALDLMVGKEIPVHNLWALIAAALAGFCLAYLFFSRRDI